MQLLIFILASVVLAAPNSRALAYPFKYVSPLYAPYALLTLGTPAQNVSCVFDIGFSDTLTLAAGNDDGTSYLDRFNPSRYERTDPIYGFLARVTSNKLQSYNGQDSESLAYNGTSKQFIWNQYQTVQGLWGQELIGLNGVNWTSWGTIGLINSTNTTNCVVGLGPMNGEIAGAIFENHEVTPRYNNLVEMLVQSNVISTRSFSIWFNKTAEEGSVVFGGTDAAKYIGNLTSVPIVSYVSSGNQVSHIPGTVLSNRIMFHGLSVYYNSKSPQSTAFPEVAQTVDTAAAAIDPSSDSAVDVSVRQNKMLADNATEEGWTPALVMSTSITVDLSTLELFTRLPRQMVDHAATMLGLTYIDELEMYAGSCDAEGMLRFNMSSYFNDVALSDVLVPAADMNITDWKMSDGSPLCFLTILPETSYSYVMGNGILRNFYLFVDLSLETVSFAPLNQSAQPEDINIKAYEYNDRYNSMNNAPGYSCTSLTREVSASFYTTGVVANGNASVVNSSGRLMPLSSLFYLFLYYV